MRFQSPGATFIKYIRCTERDIAGSLENWDSMCKEAEAKDGVTMSLRWRKHNQMGGLKKLSIYSMSRATVVKWFAEVPHTHRPPAQPSPAQPT